MIRAVRLLLLCSLAPLACKPSPASSDAGAGSSDGGGGSVDAGVPCPTGMPRVCPGDFNIVAASDLDALAGCTEVGGSITVVAPDLQDLSALHCLETLNGNLSIGGHQVFQMAQPPANVGPTQLTSLAGLDSLATVKGALIIGGTLEVWMPVEQATVFGPANLQSLDGVRSLRSIGRFELAPAGPQWAGADPNHLVSSPFVLHDLSALDGVHVTGTMGNAAAVSIQLDGTALQLPHLVLGEGTTVVLGGSAITSLAGPTWPAALNGLSLMETGVATLQPLSAVTDLPGGLMLVHNTALATLAGLENVAAVGALTVINNDALLDLSGLGATTATSVTLIAPVVTPAHALPLQHAQGVVAAGSVTALAHLQSATNFTLGSNRFIQGDVPGTPPPTSSLAGLGALTQLGEGTFADLADQDLSGLSALTQATKLTLVGKAADPDPLTGLSEFFNLQSLAGLNANLNVPWLQLYQSAATSLAGLPALAATLELEIMGTNITNMTGLGPLPALGYLAVVGNGQLTSLAGLENITPSTKVSISSNPRLAQCLVDAYRERLGFGLDQELGGGGWLGNAPYCTCHADGTATCPGAACTSVPSSSPGPVVGGPGVFPITVSTQAELDLLNTYTCAGTIYLRDGLTDVTLPNLHNAEMIIVMSTTLRTLSLPVLEQVGGLWTDAGGVTNSSLTSVSAPALTDAAEIMVNCGLTAVPLATIDLPALQRVGRAFIRYCPQVAECAVTHDLAAATILQRDTRGLNTTCTCDASGAVQGTCP